MKVAIILGTRPEAIKLAPVILAFRQDADMECRVCVTAQHRQMLDQVLQVFDIKADVDLDLMTANQSLARFTATCIEGVDRYLEADLPDMIVVQGDTTTVFCAALAAFYRNIPVGHVEAGLRTWDLGAPWPEEANRILTSRLAMLHFAPTALSRENLLREGVPEADIVVTGNTVVDALLLALERVRQEPPTIPQLPDFPAFNGGDGTAPGRIVLITGHRRESFGAAFENICQSISDLAARFEDVHFVYPVHLNPNVREPVMRMLSARRHKNVHLTEPLGYLPFVWLMYRSTLILSDSGGIQEEAPSLGKPVLVMRDVTERPEAVEAGSVRLVGRDRQRIVDEVSRLLTDAAAYAEMARVGNPYGDGNAAVRILRRTKSFLAQRARR